MRFSISQGFSFPYQFLFGERVKLHAVLRTEVIGWDIQWLFSASATLYVLDYPYCQGRQWHPTPVLLPGKSHGWRSLVGCSPWGCEELDTTEQLHFHFSLSCIGEGNGNPVQCSCLENPRDRGTWWAAVYAVTQSRTRLKWLSSSSSIHIVAIDKISSCVIAE